MEKNQQELIFRLSMCEQQMQQIQQQLEAVEQGIVEIYSLGVGLNELVGSTGKEVLAPIGRGVFVKTNLASEDLIVDVGGKNFVKKTVPETKKIIEEQIEKLEDVKKELNNNMEMVKGEFESIIEGAEGK